MSAPFWESKVRAAAANLAEPFDVAAVCNVIGARTGDSTARQGVQHALVRLARAGELDQQTRKTGNVRTVSFFTRTATFRGETFDFEAQKRASLELQALAVTWGNRRNDRSHAAAE